MQLPEQVWPIVHTCETPQIQNAAKPKTAEFPPEIQIQILPAKPASACKNTHAGCPCAPSEAHPPTHLLTTFENPPYNTPMTSPPSTHSHRAARLGPGLGVPDLHERIPRPVRPLEARNGTITNPSFFIKVARDFPRSGICSRGNEHSLPRDQTCHVTGTPAKYCLF